MLVHAHVPTETPKGPLRQSAGPSASELGIDAQFIVMLDAFRPHGGLARLRELAPRIGAEAMLRGPTVLRFDWSGQTWVPLFQFEPASRMEHAAIGPIVEALQPTHDGWQICTWFARCCAQLGGAVPVDRLADAPQAVLTAARHAGQLRIN